MYASSKIIFKLCIFFTRFKKVNQAFIVNNVFFIKYRNKNFLLEKCLAQFVWKNLICLHLSHNY